MEKMIIQKQIALGKCKRMFVPVLQ